MAQLKVRNLGIDAKQRLQARATRNGRSLEAEACAILEEATALDAAPILRNDEKGFGDLMNERFKESGLTDEEFRRFNNGIAEINSRWEMRIPDFEADDFEDMPSSQ